MSGDAERTWYHVSRRKWAMSFRIRPVTPASKSRAKVASTHEMSKAFCMSTKANERRNADVFKVFEHFEITGSQGHWAEVVRHLRVTLFEDGDHNAVLPQ